MKKYLAYIPFYVWLLSAGFLLGSIVEHYYSKYLSKNQNPKIVYLALAYTLTSPTKTNKQYSYSSKESFQLIDPDSISQIMLNPRLFYNIADCKKYLPLFNLDRAICVELYLE